MATASTSRTDGIWSPAPGDPLTPTNELAKPLCAEHVRKQLQRLYRAARALPGSILRGGQAPQEILGFFGPTAADLTSDDDQLDPAIATALLWVCFHVFLGAHPELCRATRPPGNGSWQAWTDNEPRQTVESGPNVVVTDDRLSGPR